ncbi:DoxX family protein [Yoonia sp. GPGPB17]|uniref:DoxX family protein n=1 Tax=Yoonia sp. GPGPB17 TaxID=3026147 RepID=UPI0030C2F525
MPYVFMALRVLLTVIFVAAGGAKLIGVSMMVETFDAIGWGQWFRYLTASVELGAAAMLWVPFLSVLGSSMLFATMICGALFHIFVIGPSAVPALVLAVLCCILFWIDRARLELFMARLGFA